MARRPRGQLRQDILNTVIELLISTGDVDSVSIDAVVERVGCTPPALYYYFPTKSELLRQACLAEFQKLGELVEQGVGDGPGRPLLLLARRGFALLQWAHRNPALYRILFMGSGRPGTATDGDFTGDASLQATVADLQAAVTGGLFEPAEVDELTLLVWGIAHGYASIAVSFPGIELAALEASLRVAMDAVGQRLMTPAGRAAWSRALADQAGETVRVEVSGQL